METLPDIGMKPYAIGSFVHAKLYMSTDAPPGGLEEDENAKLETYPRIDQRE
jgi:hypothetical protein